MVTANHTMLIKYNSLQSKTKPSVKPSIQSAMEAVSGAATPQPAIAPGHELQAVLIARPIRVFRQLEIHLGRLPAFAVLPHLLHLGGGLLHQREDILRILLGAEAATRLAGMSGDQLLPVQRDDLFDELLRFERIDVDEAAPGKRPDRDRVDNEHNLLLRQQHY